MIEINVSGNRLLRVPIICQEGFYGFNTATEKLRIVAKLAHNK